MNAYKKLRKTLTKLGIDHEVGERLGFDAPGKDIKIGGTFLLFDAKGNFTGTEDVRPARKRNGAVVPDGDARG